MDFTTTDLIDYALTQKPVEFEHAFNSLIADKLTAAVDMKKIEVAQSIYSGGESVEYNNEDDQ